MAFKKFSEIIEVAQKRIELDPTNLQHYITLTAAYLQAGRRVEAVQTLQEIIKLGSDHLKTKWNIYIKEIQAGRNP